MAYIVERKNKKGSNYYLAIGRRINGKTKVDFLPLGNKDPLPKGMPRTNLPSNWEERLKKKAKQRATKPAPRRGQHVGGRRKQKVDPRQTSMF